jgi:Ca2+-binding EF-hand superfamily protein
VLPCYVLLDDDDNGVVDYNELVTFVYDLLDHLDREDYIRQFQEAAREDNGPPE